ncbi:hypothetical protein M434DRAFT_28078 [Hypoxylon sp. CO27-5]|nr:hypothetical protein M434DRAFT_28078 [Hypoxylon sp. CO27-5]
MDHLRETHKDAPQWVQRIIYRIELMEDALIGEHEFLLESDTSNGAHSNWAVIDRAIRGLQEYDRECIKLISRAGDYPQLQLYIQETRQEILNLIGIYQEHNAGRKSVKKAPKKALKKRAPTPPLDSEVIVISSDSEEGPNALFPRVLPPAPPALASPPAPSVVSDSEETQVGSEESEEHVDQVEDEDQGEYEDEEGEGEEGEGEEGGEEEGEDDGQDDGEDGEEEGKEDPTAPVARDVTGDQYTLIHFGRGYARRLPRKRQYPY